MTEYFFFKEKKEEVFLGNRAKYKKTLRFSQIKCS